MGVAQAATPLAFWWLDTATVYALGLVLIASVYIGFAVADGRRTVLAVEAVLPACSSSSPACISTTRGSPLSARALVRLGGAHVISPA
jgi:hypothetical protein